MGRRPHAGRDRKIIQGQRRDEFFKKMRRKGGVARTPAMGLAQAGVADAALDDTSPMEEAETQFEVAAEAPAASEEEVAVEETSRATA
jgi:hypothetical protein